MEIIPHYHDLARRARRDPSFQSEINECLMKQTNGKLIRDEEMIAKVYRLCDYNPGFLLPYFFPNCFGPGQPLSLSRRAFAFPLYAMLLNGFLAIRGSRQISKSTNLAARQLVTTNVIPRWKSYYVAPHPEHVKTYALKVAELAEVFRYKLGANGARNNMYRKEMAHTASFMELMHVLTSASKTRGKTADEILFDEYQLFDMRLEAEIAQMQRTSKTPMTVYAGTSTTLDSPLEVRYSQSSQGVWMMRSRSNIPGQKFIDMSDPGLFIKMIQRQCLCCPYTGLPIEDPTRGYWYHRMPDAFIENNRLGLHVPQVLVPDFINGEEWDKIWKYLCDYGETRTLQEVGGIAVENGLKELSEQNLRDICILPFKTMAEIQTWVKKAPRYKYIVSGCDWGGSDYQATRKAKTSYTLHSMLGITADGMADIIHMERHSGMDYKAIGRKIVTKHMELGGTYIASDYGAGAAYNPYLHNDAGIHPNTHWVFEYGPPRMQMIKRPPHAMFSTHLMLNRTESITLLLQTIKELRIRCWDYETAQPLLSDLLNFQRVHSETQQGRQFFLFISNPASPNDTLHSLNFANVLAHMVRGTPLLRDSGLEDYVREHFTTFVRQTFTPGANPYLGGGG